MAHSSVRISTFVFATLVVAGCSSDGGTTVTLTPTTLVVVSGNNQTGTVDQGLAAAILVQVNDQSGNPMGDRAVAFSVTQGGGQVANASVTTGGDGRASTNWALGTTAGTNHAVRAAVTGAPGVTATFAATGTADTPTTLSTSSPANQFSPTGGTLPDPISVTVEDQFGNGVVGETVEFVVAAGNGSVDPTMAVTDATGQASTVWTLESTVGQQTLDVQVPAEAGVGPIQFTADAIALFLGEVLPDPLTDGVAATLTGSGFDPVALNNVVTIDGVPATVTMATATQLDVLVPTLGCKPARDVDVEVTVASVTTNTVSHPVAPASFLTIEVGEQLLITDPDLFCLQFAASTEAETYLIGVQSVSEVPSSLTDVQLVAEKDPAAPAPPQAPLASVSPQGFGQDLVITDRMRRWDAHRQAHTSFQSQQRASLNLSGAGAPMASGPSRIPADVVEGQMLSINVPDLATTGSLCGSQIAITAEVRYIGTKGVWLEDVANPSGGFQREDYEALSDQLDNTIYDIDEAEFGVPTDLDGNDRIAILVTHEVNKASESTLGFVFSGDLVSVASCPGSNEAELYYGKAPDPTNSAGGGEYLLIDALADAPSLIAHEFVHIIQFGVRIAAGNCCLSQWEAEGQATLGEEIVTHEMLENTVGQNYGRTVGVFDGVMPTAYVVPFLDMAQYFGWDSTVLDGVTKVDGAPQQCTWLSSNPVRDGSDPFGPCVGGRQVYGVPWSFLRWLNDQFAADFIGGEQELQRAIVSGTQSGFDNISAVIGEPISLLLAQWAATLYVDDRVFSSASPRLAMTSWNLFDIFEMGLNTGLRLAPTALGFTDFTETIEVRAASTGYFRIFGNGRPATAVRARDLFDGSLPSSMQFWVVRLQ